MPLGEIGEALLLAAARKVVEALRARGWRLATAESCTGGGVAHAITAIPGSSEVFDRGFVTYSNDAKVEMLGVALETLGRHGAVSEPVAREMADGALRASRANVTVAITGIAGPEGGTADKPVGTVCFAWATLDSALVVRTEHLSGDRAAVRTAAIRVALDGVLALASPDATDVPRTGGDG